MQQNLTDGISVVGGGDTDTTILSGFPPENDGEGGFMFCFESTVSEGFMFEGDHEAVGDSVIDLFNEEPDPFYGGIWGDRSMDDNWDIDPSIFVNEGDPIFGTSFGDLEAEGERLSSGFGAGNVFTLDVFSGSTLLSTGHIISEIYPFGYAYIRDHTCAQVGPGTVCFILLGDLNSDFTFTIEVLGVDPGSLFGGLKGFIDPQVVPGVESTVRGFVPMFFCFGFVLGDGLSEQFAIVHFLDDDFSLSFDILPDLITVEPFLFEVWALTDALVIGSVHLPPSLAVGPWFTT